MGIQTYKATGVFLRALERILKLNLRVTGGQTLAPGPTLFIVNHFTRFETLIVPYVIYGQVNRQVRSLADHALFKGVLGRYLLACGNISTHEPLRNRTIIGDLITNRFAWVIYPEGTMVKNKKIVENGRLMLNNPKHQGPPHTGAAVLALKAEMFKRRYCQALAMGDTQQEKYYQDRYHIDDSESVCSTGTVIVPVNITYYPLRPDKNLLHRLARLLRADLHAKLDEELQVEGSILLGDTDMSVHFGSPIHVADYLDKPTELLRRVAGLVSKRLQVDLLLKRQARRLTRQAMRSIYQNTEINFDHLFCFGLRALKQDVISTEAMRQAMYLAATELRKHDQLRLHPHLINSLTPLVAGQPFEPLDSIVSLACECGAVSETAGQYNIDRSMLQERFDFNEIRLRNPIKVIANELEPIATAVRVLRRCVNLSDRQLKQRVSKAIWHVDRFRFHQDYYQLPSDDSRKPIEIGEPFLLESTDTAVGVVLVHGYLSAPAEIRLLAEHLHDHGVTVYGVSLKGHGMVPKALKQVSWQDWLESTMRGCIALRHRCEKVVIGGFSLGGVLALYMAATQGALIDGVFSINAPLKLYDRRMTVMPAVLMWNKLLRTLRVPFGSYDTISNAQTESPDINYRVNYLSSVKQVKLAMEACRKQLSSITVPAMVVQATDDPIVHINNGKEIFQNIGSQEKVFVELDFNRHIIVRGDDSQQVFENIDSFIDRIKKPPKER